MIGRSHTTAGHGCSRSRRSGARLHDLRRSARAELARILYHSTDMGGGASVGRMWIVAFILSLVVAAFGALGVVAPESLGAVAASLSTPTGLHVAAVVRIVLG